MNMKIFLQIKQPLYLLQIILGPLNTDLINCFLDIAGKVLRIRIARVSQGALKENSFFKHNITYILR